MKKHFIRSISVFLAVWLLAASPMAGGGAAVHAEGQAEPQFRSRSLVVDAKDEDGNFLKPYWTDEDGNVIERKAEPAQIEAAESLPASYDLRSEGCVTPIKDQAAAGSCWAFAMISCMESSMIRQGYSSPSETDYSEAHLVWFGQRQHAADPSDPTYGDGRNVDNPFDDGSNKFHSAATLARGSGVELESNAPWTNPTSVKAALRDMEQPESNRYVSYGRMYEADWLPNYSVSEAKTLLMKNGNLELSYYDASFGWNEKTNCYYQKRTTSSNHEVAIVGWDDNFSRKNFRFGRRPSADGAWLVKGSWSEDWGDNGYYWLSYYDRSIGLVSSLVAKPASTYDNIYQYDGSLTMETFYDDGVMYAANRFRSVRDETLTHVMFESDNIEYVNAKVEIYVANDGYTVPGGNDPTENMTLVPAATTVMRNIRFGYYTVELRQPVDVSGKYYTVVLTLTNPGGGEVDASVEGFSDDMVSFNGKPGQSFLAMSNKKWADCSNINGKNYHNVPIKGLTKNAVSSSEGTMTITPFNAQFAVGGKAEFTCTVRGFDSRDYQLSATTQSGSALTASFGAMNGGQSVLTVSGNTPCQEKVTIKLREKKTGALLLPQKTVQVTVTPPEADAFTVTSSDLAFETSQAGTVTCSYTGFSGYENLIMRCTHTGGDKVVEPSVGEWFDRECDVTFTASRGGTETVDLVLCDAKTDAELARQTVQITVTKARVSFFSVLWDIITFPFYLLLYPFIIIFSILF